MHLTVSELEQATAGVWQSLPAVDVHGISTDSRRISKTQTFLALRGPSFDGHAFAPALDGKTEAWIGDSTGATQWISYQTPQLIVPNTLIAYGQIAHAWRKKLSHATVIGITGSYGKTTIRSMLQHVLMHMGLSVHATQDNLNNRIGVPQTILAAPDDCDVMIVECGISERGEMQHLAATLAPDMAIFSGVAAAHGAGLGSMHDIANEKSLLLQVVPTQGVVCLGHGVSDVLQPTWNAKTYDMDANDSVQATLQDSSLTLQWHDETASLTLPLPARHWAEDMALVAQVVLHIPHITTTLADIAAAFASWVPVPGRMQQVTGTAQRTILNDCYNANPASMQAALNTLAACPAPRIAILGDMAELGEQSQTAHQQLNIAETDMVFLAGAEMHALHQKHPHSQWFPDTDTLIAALRTQSFAPQATMLIKASRSMRFEHIIPLFTQEHPDAV